MHLDEANFTKQHLACSTKSVLPVTRLPMIVIDGYVEAECMSPSTLLLVRLQCVRSVTRVETAVKFQLD